MKRPILIWVIAAVIISSLAGNARAQQPATAQPKVDAIFSGYDKTDSPGCALGVIRDGKLIYTRGYGMANLEHNIPLTSKTVFDIGSTSKQFTTSSILLLAQQGKLSLDDDIRKYVPELPQYGQPITIRQLANHTSGIRDYLTLMSVTGVNFDGITGEDEALKLIVRQKQLNFTPGSEHLYSNSGYFLLGVIVKRASGKSLVEFAQEHIFGPLAMRETHYHSDHTLIVPRRATGYAAKRGGGYRIDVSGFEQVGDGAVYTTVEDLALWDADFYTPKVGGQALIDGLLTNGVLNSGEKIDYAVGLVNAKYKGLQLISHGGSWAGYRAELIRFPQQKFSVICLCNRADANPSRLARQVADVYLADQFKPVDVGQAGAAGSPAGNAPAAMKLSEEQLRKYAGTYRNPANGAMRRLRVADGKLRAGQAELIPVAADRFVIDAGESQVELVFSDDANGRQVTVNRANAKPEVFAHIVPPQLSAVQLADFAGSYYSEELDHTYNLDVEDGKLFYGGEVNTPRQPLEPTIRDAFGLGVMQFEFTRDANGKVNGFVLHAGRIRNVAFVKK